MGTLEKAGILCFLPELSLIAEIKIGVPSNMLYIIIYIHVYTKKVSEYDQEMPQPRTTDQP